VVWTLCHCVQWGFLFVVFQDAVYNMHRIFNVQNEISAFYLWTLLPGTECLIWQISSLLHELWLSTHEKNHPEYLVSIHETKFLVVWHFHKVATLHLTMNCRTCHCCYCLLFSLFCAVSDFVPCYVIGCCLSFWRQIYIIACVVVLEDLIPWLGLRLHHHCVRNLCSVCS